MLSDSTVRIDDAGNNGDEARASDTVTVILVGMFSHDPFRFDPFLPRIKHDSDLTAFFAKYQDTFLEDVIMNLGSEKSSRWIEGPTFDALELELFGIHIGIPTEQRVQSPSYGLDRDNFPCVPSKRRIFGVDDRMTEVTAMVCLEEVTPHSFVSIVKQFTSLVPSLSSISRKRTLEGSEDPKGKMVMIEKVSLFPVAPCPSTGVVFRDSGTNPHSLPAKQVSFFTHPAPA
ncbi:hypothetical protein F0562_005910 [Nyssa sinensis]|uniref:Uncharacterized protein n=1 Tax=Nyssa sinensis TaxID=561372 RepID=A0A5J5ANB3_9ASTE|nr:hypothetical protein F0562_005910 [Nyssa sinensis]